MKPCLFLIIIVLFAQQILTVPTNYYEYNNQIDNGSNEILLTPEPEPESIDVRKYHIFTTRVNWTEAVRQCQSKGFKLVSIYSKEDNTNVITAIRDANQGEIGFWTSGNRINTTGNYVWGNGQPITFTNWENGSPDNLHAYHGIGRQEECIEIKGYNILKWNDHLCSYKLYYICEESFEQNIHV